MHLTRHNPFKRPPFDAAAAATARSAAHAELRAVEDERQSDELLTAEKRMRDEYEPQIRRMQTALQKLASERQQVESRLEHRRNRARAALMKNSDPIIGAAKEAVGAHIERLNMRHPVGWEQQVTDAREAIMKLLNVVPLIDYGETADNVVAEILQPFGLPLPSREFYE